MTTKVVKGTLWTMIGLTVPIFFSLFATPLNTRLLGAERYGLFVLVLLIPAYFGFADFGMGIASTKFASAAFAEGDTAKEARIVRTAGLIAALTTLPFWAAMFFFPTVLLGLFKVPPDLEFEGALALRLASITFVSNFLSLIFNSPELTRLRMDINISITSGIRLLGIILTPLVIYLGGGVVGAVAVGLCVSLVTLTGHLIASARLLPQLIGVDIDKNSARAMLNFGGSLVIAGVATVLLSNLEKLVLTRVTSVETLAYYSIASTFAAMLTLFSGSIVQSLMPAFSQLQNEENRTALNKLYTRGVRLTFVWLLPAVVFMVIVGKPFFTYWFGTDFGRESTGPFYIIVGGFFFNVLAYFPFTAIMASGRSDIFARIYWIELGPYLILVWLCASHWGAIGAAFAWSLRVTCDALILFYLARRIGMRLLQLEPMRFCFAGLIMLAPITILFVFPDSVLGVFFTGVVSALIYTALAWKSILEPAEVEWFLREVRARFLPWM